MAELVEQLAERVDHLDIDNGDFYERVMAVPGNGECADCSSQELLTWASVNLGVVLCNECVGAHRSLGVHISKPLSLKMDLWDAAHQAHFLELGNRLVNATFEVVRKSRAVAISVGYLGGGRACAASRGGWRVSRGCSGG